MARKKIKSVVKKGNSIARTAARRKRCANKPCRKLAAKGAVICASCEAAAAGDASPIESSVRMTDIETLSIAKVDAELANFLQGIRIFDLETANIDREYEEQRTRRASHRLQLITMFEAKQKEQQQTVRDTALKYNMDPEKMTYDPDTGMLRDLRNDAT